MIRSDHDQASLAYILLQCSNCWLSINPFNTNSNWKTTPQGHFSLTWYILSRGDDAGNKSGKKENGEFLPPCGEAWSLHVTCGMVVLLSGQPQVCPSTWRNGSIRDTFWRLIGQMSHCAPPIGDDQLLSGNTGILSLTVAMLSVVRKKVEVWHSLTITWSFNDNFICIVFRSLFSEPSNKSLELELTLQRFSMRITVAHSECPHLLSSCSKSKQLPRGWM